MAMQTEITYFENRLLHFLNISWLDSTLRPRSQILQLFLIILNPSLKLRDVVLRISIPPVKQFAHANQPVSLELQVFQHAFIPCLRLIFQQSLAGGEMLRRATDTLVEHRNIVRVNGIRVPRNLRQ